MNLNINRDASASTYDTGIIHFADIAWMQHNVARCLLTCYNFIIISIYNYYNLALKYNKQKKKKKNEFKFNHEHPKHHLNDTVASVLYELFNSNV